MTQQEAEVILKVNAKKAEESLTKLEAKAADLRQKFADAVRIGDTKGAEILKKQISEVNKEIKKTRVNTIKIQAAMERLNEASPRDLQITIKMINKELNSGNVKRGTKEWDAYVLKLKEVKAELSKVKKEMQPDSSKSIIEKIKDGFNDWGATAAAATAAFAGVVMSGKAAVQSYADMEAEEANVRKFTGMTAEEVASLNEEFKKLDTRTSREELNKLAQEAGRLGKTSQEDVLGYVRAADQINMALDDLGDGATLTLSKLTEIFGDEKRFGTEKSLLKTGSVINDLSQKCSASAPYLAEFSSRLGGIAAQSKMTIAQVMAFGAVLDSNNLMVEASSTAVGQLITSIYQEPAKIAKAAGMDVAKFSKMVKEDMNGALIALFEQLNRFGGMDSLASVFDSMGNDGARAIPVLTALAGHIDTLKLRQEQANEAFRDGTSISKEAEVQNNTVQAQLDKAKKGFNEMAVALGEQLLPVMSYCISGSSMMMRVLSVLVDFVIKNKTELLVLATAILAYNVAIKAATISQIAHNVATATGTALTKAATAVKLLFASAINLVAGNTRRATAAFRAFSTAIKANPIGLAVSVATALIGALAALAKRMRESRIEAQKHREELERLNKEATDVSSKMSDSAAKEVAALKNLYKAAINEANSKEQRIKAAKDLIALYPDQFKNFTAEQISLGKAKKAYDELTQSIINNAKAKAAAELVLENEKKILQLEQQLNGHRENFFKAEKKMKDIAADNSAREGQTFTNMYQAGVGTPTKKSDAQARGERDVAAKNMRNTKAEINTLQKAVDSLTASYQKNAEFQKVLAPEVVTPTGNTPTLPESDKERKEREKREREARKAQREAQKEAKEALKKDLDERKSIYLQAEAKNLADYLTGEKNYADHLAKKKELELQYADDVIKIHEDHNKLDYVAYAQSLKDREDIKKKYLDEERKRSLAEAETEHKENIDAATVKYFDPSSSIFQDKKALNQMLLQEDIKYLEKKRALYTKDSEEWVEISRQIDERNKQDQLDKQKELVEAIKRYKEEFGDAGRTAAYKAEIESLDLLHKSGLIKEEEYQKALEKIRSKYRTENMSDSFKDFEDIFSRLVGIAPDKMSVISEMATNWLNGLSEEERAKLAEGFEKGFDNVIGNTLVNGLNGVLSMIDGFKDAAKGDWEGTIEDIGKMAQNAANIIGGIMSAFSSYWNAQRDIEVAGIEKRYDKEIEAAGKNSKKKKKLEEQKEADIAKVKKKYNDRAMKMEIAQAIAQTAANAISAYGAMVGIKVVGPVLAPIAAAAAVAAGMIQVATIKKQHDAQAAGYYEGGFTSRDSNNRREVGVVHANEFVANHQAVANPAISPVLRLIDTAQRNNTVGSLTAADISNALGQGSGVSARGEAATVGTATALRTGLAVVAESNSANNETMARLADALDEGIEAKVILDGEDGFHKKYKHFLKLQNNPRR